MGAVLEEATAVVTTDAGAALHTLKLRSWNVTLDESRTPYVNATIEAVLPASLDTDDITPYADQRVRLTITRTPIDGAPASRSFNLLVHEVMSNRAAATLTIIAVSDEAKWLDVARQDDAYDLRIAGGALNGLDAKTLIETYLADPPSGTPLGLAPGFTHDTADLYNELPPTFFQWRNTMLNSSFETNTTGCIASNASFVRDNSWARSGTWSLRVAAASASSYVELGGGSGGMRSGFTAGSTFLVRASVRVRTSLGTPNSTARCIQVIARDAAGNYSAIATSDQATNVVGAVTDLELEVKIPPGVTEAWVRLVHGHSSGDLQWDALLVTNIDSNISTTETGLPDYIWYFDGANVIRKYRLSAAWPPYLNVETTTHPNQEPEWSGPTPYASISLLVPEPYVQAAQSVAGELYWEPIARIMEAARLRLFCDEQRRWRLRAIGAISPTSHELTAQHDITNLTVTASRQRSVEERPLFADHIVLTVTDAIGTLTVQQSIGTPTCTWFVERTVDYWAPTEAFEALALGMLENVYYRRHLVETTCLTDLAVNPGDQVLVDGIDQVAAVVTFQSGGTMTLTSRAVEA
ncbi:hypothetical protein M2152_001992 [Microbacteriaceae bacterium SG_E_30_P1]|uniref:Phage tail protein n=1 Tax=Antiquaquibacter oligotrophicus TaxID=2880260 RepID=A0ABT6KPW1_9MICO|nr:hypothetical protein [Antiquaquibacter oligotrophicus]MDH6181810.1 hypothetical protein [Antiquaquibacter oligotrophicus]UDF12511.1 hypothetical protein LH407_10145 [Antiquaquibacter oligotrophicus]